MTHTSPDLVTQLTNGINEIYKTKPETPFFRVVDSSKITLKMIKSGMTREEEAEHIQITDVTYREEVPRLYKTANYLSLLFGSMKESPGGETPRVVVLGKQCPDTIRATLAVLLAGGAVIELFPTKSREQLLDESARSGAMLALVENKTFAEAMYCPTLTFEELEQKVASAPLLPKLPKVSVDPESLALLLFTSGTTCKAKPVLKSHQAMAANVELFRMSGLFSAGERVLSVLYLAHIYPAVAQFTQATLGLTTVLPGWRKNSNRIDVHAARFCARHGDCHILVMVPSRLPQLRELIVDAIEEEKQRSPVHKALLELAVKSGQALYRSQIRTYCDRNNLPLPAAIAESEENKFLVLIAPLLRPICRKIVEKAFGPSIRVLATGGSHIDYDSMEFFELLGLAVINGWGSTEAGILTFSHALSNGEALKKGLPVRIPSSVGYPPSPEIEFLVDDSGVLFVCSPTLADGYEGMKDKTDEVFVNIGGKRYFNTEDVVVILDKMRSLSVGGRSGRRFKNSTEEWVSPEAAEAELASHPLVSSAFVWGEGFTNCVALLSLDPLAFQKWCTEHEFDPTCQRNEALTILHDQLLEYARNVVGPKVKDDRVGFKDVILLLPPDSFEARGFITDTTKVMSRAILEAYRETLLQVLKK